MCEREVGDWSMGGRGLVELNGFGEGSRCVWDEGGHGLSGGSSSFSLSSVDEAFNPASSIGDKCFSLSFSFLNR